MEIRLPLAVGVVMALAYGGFTGTPAEDTQAGCDTTGGTASRVAAAVDPLDAGGGLRCRPRPGTPPTAPRPAREVVTVPVAESVPTAADLFRGADLTPDVVPESPDPDEFAPPRRAIDQTTHDRRGGRRTVRDPRRVRREGPREDKRVRDHSTEADTTPEAPVEAPVEEEPAVQEPDVTEPDPGVLEPQAPADPVVDPPGDPVEPGPAATDPVVEEPVVEEPVVEEPVVEEPVAEEPVAEESPASSGSAEATAPEGETAAS
jgi:hypothetical protein